MVINNPVGSEKDKGDKMKEVKLDVLNSVELTEEELREIEDYQKDLGSGGAGGAVIYCSCSS